MAARLDLPIAEIVEQYGAGMPMTEIAKHYRCTAVTIGNRLLEIGIKQRSLSNPQRLALPDKQICAAYISGMSIRKLAAKHNCSFRAIQQHLTDHGVELRRVGEPRRYNMDDAYFDFIDTEEKAYWLGFLLADGCVYCPTSGCCVVTITLAAKDVGHLEKLRSSALIENPVRVYSRKKADVANLYLYSMQWGEALAHHGVIPRKTDVGFSTPALASDMMAPFYRGYFDGDGCIHRSYKAQWYAQCLGPENFIRDFAWWISDTANSGQCHVYRRLESRDLWHWRSGGNRKVPCILTALYGNAMIYLSRKYRLYQAMLRELDLEAA